MARFYDRYRNADTGEELRLALVKLEGGNDALLPMVTGRNGWTEDPMNRLSASSTSLVRAVGWGDSVMQMYGASTWSKQWTWLWRDYMQSIYGDGGTGFLGVQYGPCASPNFDYPLSWSGSWTPAIGGCGYIAGGTTLGGVITWPNFRGTTIKLWYLAGPSCGNFEIILNAAVIQNVTTANPSFEMRTLTLRVPAGTNTFAVRITSVGNGVFISGAEAYNDTGFVFDNMAIWGQASTLVLAPAWLGAGGTDTIGKYALNMRGPTDILICDMGGNDQTGGTTLDPNVSPNFMSNLRVTTEWLLLHSPAMSMLGLVFPAASDAALANWYYNSRARDFWLSIGGAYMETFSWMRRNSYQVAKGWAPVSDPHFNDIANQLVFEAMQPIFS